MRAEIVLAVSGGLWAGLVLGAWLKGLQDRRHRRLHSISSRSLRLLERSDDVA